MEKILGIAWILLYTLGLFASQSLLSIAGLLGVLALVVDAKFWRFKMLQPGTWGLAWVLFSSLNLVIRRPEGHLVEGLRNIPLLLLPLLGVNYAPTFLAALRKHPRVCKNLVNFALFLALAALSRSLYQALVQKRPATGLLTNQIYFAYAVLPVFLFSAEMSLVQSIRKQIRTRFALTAVFIGISLVLSHTRMAWAILILWSLLRGLPYLWARKSKSTFYLSIAAATLGFAFLCYYQPDFQNKVGRIFENNDPSKVARSFIWSFNFRSLLDNLFLGLGYEQNGVIPLAKDVRELFTNAGLNPSYRIYAHNIFLQALVDNGLLGFVLWISFWLLLARENRLTRNYLIFMGLAGLTENFFNNSRAAHPFYFICVLFLVLDRYLKEESLHGQRST